MLAISFTPYAPVTAELAAMAARRNIPVVAITDSAFSPLVTSADVWLEVAEADYGAFRSLSASFALAMALAVGTAEKRAEAEHRTHSGFALLRSGRCSTLKAHRRVRQPVQFCTMR